MLATKKRTVSTRLHAKSYKFENNRRFRSKVPSANLQVTCAPASRSLAPQNPSQLHDNRSLINKHLTFTLRHEPQMGRITTAACKRTQQLWTLLRQQCWELLLACSQWCVNGCNNSCKPCKMSVRGPNSVGRAVQMDPTLFRYASAITEQKKCWELLAEKFDRFQTVQQHATTSKNMQHGVQTDAKCPTMLGVVDQHCCPVPDTTLLGVVTSACTPTTRNIVGATMSGVVASVCTQPKVVLWNSWPHLTWFEWGAIEIAPLV